MWHYLRYNARICAGLGPWILVVPVASTMLVLFALMSMKSLIRGHTPALILELLGPLVMAFVGSSLLRPEYQHNTLETVLTRPVSFRALVGARLAVAGIGVFALQVLLARYLVKNIGTEFEVWTTLLAAAVSMAFLTALAVAVAAFSRSPSLGFVAAAVFWALDVVFVGQLNPLFALSGYALSIKEMSGIFSSWQTGKAAMIVATVLLLWAAARAGARPAGQWNLRRSARASAAVAAMILVYLGSGAFHKIRWGMEHEAELGNRSRTVYKLAFQCYGTVPVAPLVSPSFARFIGYRAPWTRLRPDPDGVLADGRYYEREQLKVVAFGASGGQWVDNAQYSLGAMLISDAENKPQDEGHKLGVKCLETLIREHPDSPFAALGLEKLAHVYQRMNDVAAEESAVRTLVEQHAATQSAFRLGRDYAARMQAQGKLALARSILEPLGRHAARNDRPLVLIQLGELLAHPRIGETDQALATYEEAEHLCGEIADELGSIVQKDASQIQTLREIGDLRTEARRQLAALKGRR